MLFYSNDNLHVIDFLNYYESDSVLVTNQWWAIFLVMDISSINSYYSIIIIVTIYIIIIRQWLLFFLLYENK